MLKKRSLLGRRLRRGAVAWSILLPLTALVAAAAPASAVTCDANADGNPTGTTVDVVTDGDDDAAATLQIDTGLVVTAPQPAHQWRVATCVEVVDDGDPATPDRFVAVVGAPVQELKPEAIGWEADALDAAVGDLEPLFFRPGARTSPHVAGVQFIDVEMWLAIDPATWVPFTTTTTEGEVSVTATATPSQMVWEFTDGVTRICDGPGVQYTPGATGPAPCGRHFEHTSEVQPVTASVSIEYTITWSSTLGGSGTFTQRGEPNRYDLVVGEVQTYLSDGQRPPPVPPGTLPDPESSQPINDDDCAWGSWWDCSPADIVDAVTDLATDVVWATLPEPVKDALDAVWSFIEGCAAFVGDVFGSIQEVFAQLGGLVTDPAAFIRDKLDVARAVHDGIRADPAAFATEFLGDAIDADLLASDPAQWAGKIGCEIAVGILTGGAAASARFADLFRDVNRFTERLDDWIRRRDGDGPGACTVSSFPAGTPVLLADGSSRPIEAVAEGDAVLSFEPATGAWAAQRVLRQWSYLDTDEMATVHLADGSTVSATDHHPFWSDTRGDFVAAEDLRAGEALVTPEGVAAVAAVDVWPSAPTAVWELTVTGSHTFAVLAGGHAVAVHNRCGDLPDADGIRDALRGADLGDRISVEDVQGAWARYEGDLPADEWLRRYVTIRRNAGTGTDYQDGVLADLGLSENHDAYEVGDPARAFIPDAVRSTDPPQFVEVKNYERTRLQPSSNAGRQLDYLIGWIEDNPDAGTPAFDLYISNDQNLSDSFRARLTEAVEAGVDVTVNGQPWSDS